MTISVALETGAIALIVAERRLIRDYHASDSIVKEATSIVQTIDQSSYPALYSFWLAFRNSYATAIVGIEGGGSGGGRKLAPRPIFKPKPTFSEILVQARKRIDKETVLSILYVTGSMSLLAGYRFFNSSINK